MNCQEVYYNFLNVNIELLIIIILTSWEGVSKLLPETTVGSFHSIEPAKAGFSFGQDDNHLNKLILCCHIERSETFKSSEVEISHRVCGWRFRITPRDHGGIPRLYRTRLREVLNRSG